MSYLKLHRNYLLNKFNVLIISFITFIGVLVMLAGILSIRQEYNIFDYVQASIEYIELFCLYYKLVMINLFCYLWGNAFSEKADSYKYLIAGYNQKRTKYLLSKILFLHILTLFIVFINLFIFTILGVLWGKMYLNYQIIIELLLKVVFISIIYGLLSSIFSMFINSNLVYFMSSGLFVFGELIKENSNNNLYYVFFPKLDNVVISHLFCLFIIYLFIVIIRYLTKRI